MLCKPDIQLLGRRQVQLHVMGKFTALIEKDGRSIPGEIFVVPQLMQPLLSGKASESLNLIKRPKSIEKRNSLNPFQEYPKLFTGLGTLQGSYTIKLKDESQPHAIYAPRRIPIPLLNRKKNNLIKWLKKELDANSGFWQIPLSEESSSLTTFLTPFGRYRFKRLPFGISSAPEVFQRKISNLLESQSGVNCHIDDILQNSGLTLNKEKCIFSVKEIKFLGHLITERGVLPDPNKVQAIREFPSPSSISEVRRFLGMVNFTSKFIPDLSTILYPLNQLLVKRNDWRWDSAQEEAFEKVKKLLSTSPTLTFFDPNLPTTVSADASSYGLGAVLLQKSEDGYQKAVAYASGTMSETEKRWAQIEKESLAIVWACEIFQDYLMGNTFSILTDHKPLIPIFSTKNLDEMTPRIQRLRLRMMSYSYSIHHTPGKDIVVADALSRSPIKISHVKDLENEICNHYSRFPELALLEDQTTHSTIKHCKSIFARRRISEEVRSDNGPQFGLEFKRFAKEYGFHHITSSPRFTQSNGFIESMVKNIKNHLKKGRYPYLSLLGYRTAPLENGYSPAELCMNRKLRTTVPTSPVQLQSRIPDLENLEKKREKINGTKRKPIVGTNSDIPIFKIYVEEFNTYANQFDEICQQRNLRRLKLYHTNIAELFKTIKETYYQIVRSSAVETSETLFKEYIDVKNRYENFVLQIEEILEVENVSQPVKSEQSVISNVKLPKFNLPVFSVYLSQISTTIECTFNKHILLLSGAEGSIQILLSTAIIHMQDVNGEDQICRALLDNGSQRSPITEKCAAKLGIPIRRKRIAVGGLGDQLVESSLGEVLIRFSSHFDHQSFETTALVLTKLTNNIPSFTVKKINYSHMKGLILADPSYFKSREIDVILGSDIIFNLIQEERRNGNENEPSAIHSKLGWLVYGPTSVSERQSFRNLAHFSSELESEDLIKRFWELESIPLEEIPTKEEKDCESHYLKNVVRDESGRYIVRLPFKESAEKLGQSKSIAIRRFLNLEKRLEQNESIYAQYKQFMNEYIRLGHISGKQNPADLATRGILPSCLINSKLWWHGPVWLALDGSENIPSFTIDPSMGLEERSVILHATIAEPCPEFFSKYSSFTKLLRVMAWCKRFINITRKQPTQRLSFLTSQDLKDSLLQIVKIIQRCEFTPEINACIKNIPLPRKSRLISLNIFVDSQGILRVGGRLRHSDLDIDQKHPMLIPKDHLSKSKAIHQIMGDLPKNRLLPGRPFEKIGIDLAGPIQAKPMLKRSKVIFQFYIVLFVCFPTKAIHLEISSDLTAETFLAALKRFISRRGRPTDIYSDNATNFKGASNILKERWKLFKAANIQDFSAIESINWHFIPPSAPNFGGLWEAGIKSVKTILSKTMKSRLLNYEELLTLLAQIEACLNSRPLTFVSNDPNDLTALTPGHFLIGNAMRHDAESDHSTLNLRSRWGLIQPQRDYFWNRWSCEYLHQLQERRKWRTSHPDVNIGDLVMLKEQNKPLQWKLARIVQIFPGEDDHVRVVLLRTPKGLLKRPITKICPLPYKE
ncbi:K02A2.6-like [Cordylochernes scorpioides]|uniref:K02A2.6-like n=1 Tax=Cordylochernes scorpioides TaxID=51811 RepID=A0ABY6LQD2_9ARAC|nr:K02A2.6-like [Cordylochernes scorpioides]